MSAVTSDSLAREWARRLERREASRTGLPLSLARVRLAARLGVGPGTLENLSRNRMKGIREWLFQTLRQALLDELSRELSALRHEMDCLALTGLGPDDPSMVEVAQALEKAKKALKDSHHPRSSSGGV